MAETKRTVVDEIWNEIKDLPIAIYSLKGQTVKDHVAPKPIPGDVLFLKPRSPAVVAILQETVGDKYVVNSTDMGFITVEKVEPLPVDDEYIYFQRRGKTDKIRKKDLIG